MSNLQVATSLESVPQPFLQEEHWYAAYVITRHEKAVAEQLVRRSVESFLPLYRTVHWWKGRRASVELPLFPSYIFVRISHQDRLRVLRVPSIVHIVSFQGAPATVPDKEIETLQTALRMRKCEPYAYLSSGKRVRINEGPLQGLEGVVVRHHNQSRIIVSVDFIRRSTSVELAPEDLEWLPEWAEPPQNSLVDESTYR